jgi:hypothetical protein
MENIIGLIELSKEVQMKAATCYDTPVWQFMSFSNQTSLLPFMVKSDEITPIYSKISALKINQVDYERRSSIAEVRACEHSFYQDKDAGMVYFHNPDHNPTWMYYLPSSNVVIGLSTDKLLSIDDVLYSPGALSMPAVKDEADDLEYSKMKFKTASYNLINTKGEYDDAMSFFGNEFAIKHSLFPYTEAMLDYVYFISNVKIKLDKTALSLSDKRSRLAYKIPNEEFTEEEYPFGESDSCNQGNLWGKTKQDAYGHCINVPAVCVNAAQTEAASRTFRVARRITTLDKVEVKMTQPVNDDGDFQGETWTDQTGNAHIDNGAGTFTMLDEYCMPGKSSQSEWPEVYEVRVTGTFHPASAPLDVLRVLFTEYCGMDWTDYNFNCAEMEAELGHADVNKTIGALFDKPIDIYAAIEQLQTASIAGWRLKTSGRQFTARRDDNDRAPWGIVGTLDATNLDEVEIDLNATNYATIIDVSYAKNYAEDDEAQHMIDDSKRQEIIKLYKIDKTYSANSLLKNQTDAAEKAKKLATHFSKPRQMINNIVLFGVKWLTLRVYDIVEIDLTADAKEDAIESRIARTRDYGTGNIIAPSCVKERYAIATRRQRELKRNFGGVIKCKVMSVNIDLNACTNTIDALFVG